MEKKVIQQWTKQQQEAIDAPIQGLMVSAAAGSGKTAVLSNRIGNYIKNGGSIDRLLVVTFTRAATAEMRQRIAKVIFNCYKENPTEHLKKQKLLVYNAKICTVDSFCYDLLRKNFQRLKLSPDFSILDEIELNTIKTNCLEELLEEYYSDYKNDFASILFLFGGESDSNNLSGVIQRIYNFFQDIPFIESWINQQLNRYKDAEFWTSWACKLCLENLEDYLNIYKEVYEAEPFNEKGMELVYKELCFLNELCDFLKNTDWDNACVLIDTFIFDKAPPSTGSYIKVKFKTMRDRLKKYLESEVFTINTNAAVVDLDKLYGGIKALFDLVLEYIQRIEKEFSARNKYSFSFIARQALTLLIKDYNIETGSYIKTPLADEIIDKFDEVLVDEYQDISDMQDLFFRVISDNNKNLFAVGDVKQSIYGFRGANPMNFLRKKDSLKVISLNKNFRSKKSILDYVNFICKPLFNDKFTHMEYDDEEKLYNGFDTHCRENDIELHFVPSKKEDETGLDLESDVLQATFCASRIKSLISSGYKIRDGENERLVQLSDFVILLRNLKNTSGIYSEVFRREGVPLILGGKNSFWESIEVNTLLAYLRVIDNPFDDVSVFAVLFSEIFAFSADKLASLRITDRESPLYTLVEQKKETDGQCADFIRMTEHFRLLSQNLPIYRLVWEILIKTKYLSKVSCIGEMGYIRRENLIKFYGFSRKYADSISGGLFKFLRFAYTVAEKGGEKEEDSGGKGDYVKLMSIHGSKGLEFPVCILPRINGEFNFYREASKATMFLDNEIGIGTRIRDKNMLFETTTMPMEIVRMKQEKEMRAEELRLLYVAMTRAKDKLILVDSDDILKVPKSGLSKLEKAAIYLDANERKIYNCILNKIKSFEEFIIYSTVHHPKAYQLHSDYNISLPADGENIYVDKHDDVESSPSKINDNVVTVNLDITELKRRFDFKYNYNYSKIPAKVSVTELVKGVERDVEGDVLIKPEITHAKPKFLSDSKLSPAEKGTAIHTFCQYADLSKDTEEEISRLEFNYYITEAQAKAIDREKIEDFKNGFVAELISKSDVVRKEENFVTRIPASFYSKGFTTKDVDENEKTILLQGAIDLLCEFSDGIVLVDYKTDRLGEKELLNRYSLQLFLYKKATESMFKKKVKNIYIWSFHLSKAIDCTDIIPD